MRSASTSIIAWSIYMLLIGLGSKLASDQLNYAQHGYDAEYLPISQPALGLTLYLSLAVYPLLGWTMLRRTEQPARIAGTALLGSLVFFLITNFSSWLRQDLPYPMTAAGLMESYWMGLPFLRGTLMGDLTFTAVLFGLHAVLSRATAPADRLVRIPVEHASR